MWPEGGGRRALVVLFNAPADAFLGQQPGHEGEVGLAVLDGVAANRARAQEGALRQVRRDAVGLVGFVGRGARDHAAARVQGALGQGGLQRERLAEHRVQVEAGARAQEDPSNDRRARLRCAAMVRPILPV